MKTSGFDLLMSTNSNHFELRRLAVNSSLVGIADLRLDGFRMPPRLILESMIVSSEPATGRDRPPLASWGVVAMPESFDKSDPAYWIERCKPQPSQTFLILLLGTNVQRDHWKAWVVTGDHVQTVNHIQGLGRLSFQTRRLSAELPHSFAMHDRWSRTIEALGPSVFQQLKQTTVLLIGCSGVGTQIAIQLASLPIGRLGLADGDLVEPHNLCRMALASEADIGRSKAHVLGERILAMRSDMAIMVSDKAFGYRTFEPVANNADLIITAVDQDLPRLAASRICRHKFIPHLDVGTSLTKTALGTSLAAIDIRWLLPGSGCVSCVGGLRGREQAEYELRAPAGALPRVSESWQARGRLGSLTTLNATAAATAIQVWLENVNSHTFQSCWHRINWEKSTWATDWLSVGADSDCKICKNSSAISNTA